MKGLARITSLSFIFLSFWFIAYYSVSFAYADLPWEQVQKLHASDGAIRDQFGSHVAVSGSIAVVGVPLDDDHGDKSGAAYLFDVMTGEQLYKLVPSDGGIKDHFGISVAIDGNIAVIGAPSDNDHGAGSGSVYVFDVVTGEQLFKLSPSDSVADQRFGNAVSVSGNLVAIGAQGDSEHGYEVGAVYIFDVSTGEEITKIFPPDSIISGYFGHAIAINGTMIVASSPRFSSGKAYVFDVTTGNQLFDLAPDIGYDGDNFGDSVSIDGGFVLIGAPQLGNLNGNGAGYAVLFDLSTGEQIYRFSALDREAGDHFGYSVSLSGNFALIGSPYDDDQGGAPGSSYLFNVDTGEQITKLLPSDGKFGDQFGFSVALDGDFTIIGAPLDDDLGRKSGSVYLFQRRTTNLLTVSPEPLVAGLGVVFNLVTTLPNEDSWLLYSTNGPGHTFISQLNITVQLANPQIAGGPLMTDENGDLRVARQVPEVLGPLNIWFQAVQLENSTNVVATEIVP